MMVDVGAKAVTERVAIAEGFVRLSADLEARLRAGDLPKGPALEVARLAGIMAAKRTDELIPLCHTLPLDGVNVTASMEPGRVRFEATVRVHARTGAEMEALTAVCVAALAFIDMGKAVDRAMRIDGVRVLAKSGGRHGPWRASEPADRPDAGDPPA